MKKLILILVLMFTACGPMAPAEQTTLTVMTHDSFSISEDVVRSFEEANNVTVTFLPAGDTGAVLNKAILSKDSPLADVLFGVDNTYLSRALDEGIFEPYASTALANIPSDLKLDESYRALPVDFGDVCINYDKAYFAGRSLPVPQSLEDLAKPDYANLLVVENPATSSTGLAFLIATIAHFGSDYLDYWSALRANGVVVVDGWETAYYTNFSGSSGRGPQPMVVSYATSPAAEVIFADPPVDDAPTASILGPDTCFRQIEFVGILAGTPHRGLAERFVDFMLSDRFQADVPMQMFVYPADPNIPLPEEFVRYAETPAQAATLPPAEIAANRDRWIQEWTEVVLK